MRKNLCFLIVLLFLAGNLIAQKDPQKPGARDKWEVYAGYNFERSFGDFNYFNASDANHDDFYSPYNLQGAQVSAAYFPWKHVGVKVAYDYAGKSANITCCSYVTETAINRSYLIGPVVRWTVPGVLHNRISVFGQQLVGATHMTGGYKVDNQPAGCLDSSQGCRASGLSLVTGGGAEVRVYRFLSVRPVEVDYWNHQLNFNHLMGLSNSYLGETNYSVEANGLRYSAGISAHF